MKDLLDDRHSPEQQLNSEDTDPKDPVDIIVKPLLSLFQLICLFKTQAIAAMVAKVHLPRQALSTSRTIHKAQFSWFAMSSNSRREGRYPSRPESKMERDQSRRLIDRRVDRVLPLADAEKFKPVIKTEVHIL